MSEEVVVSERKNFIIRKNLIGKGQVIKFFSKSGKERIYDHDACAKIMLPKLETLNCWAKYGFWTQSTDIPVILRDIDLLTGKKLK